MDDLQRAMAAAAALQRQADAAGVGRISQADREAAHELGDLLSGDLWLLRPHEVDENARHDAHQVAAQVRATRSGFALALAEWLERWVGEAGRGRSAYGGGGPLPAQGCGVMEAATRSPSELHAALAEMRWRLRQAIVRRRLEKNAEASALAGTLLACLEWVAGEAPGDEHAAGIHALLDGAAWNGERR